MPKILQMKKLSTLSLLLFYTLTLLSQENITIGTTHTLHSKILNEDRKVLIYLPDAYNNKEYELAKYPVVYLLDGEQNFHSFTGISSELSKGPYAHIPQMIVVAICNTNRTRDLTPSLAGEQSFFTKNNKKIQQTGGNNLFINFIAEELQPYIDSNFRTSGYKVLNGHSFGGLTAINILLNHTELFNAYVIIDPSLWWDDELLNKQADSILGTTDFKKRNVFIAMAQHKVIAQDATTNMERGINNFKHLLETKKPNNLRWGFHFYEKEDHGTIPIPAEYDGLRFLFENHLIKVKEAVNNPELVEQSFQKLSAQTGFNFYPSQPFLEWMINYCTRIEQPKQATPFVKMLKKYYNAE